MSSRENGTKTATRRRIALVIAAVAVALSVWRLRIVSYGGGFEAFLFLTALLVVEVVAVYIVRGAVSAMQLPRPLRNIIAWGLTITTIFFVGLGPWPWHAWTVGRPGNSFSVSFDMSDFSIELDRSNATTHDIMHGASGYHRLLIPEYRWIVMFEIPLMLGLWIDEARRRIPWLNKPSLTFGCVTCGYDLRGNVSGICPECGTSIRRAKGRSTDLLLSNRILLDTRATSRQDHLGPCGLPLDDRRAH